MSFFPILMVSVMVIWCLARDDNEGSKSDLVMVLVFVFTSLLPVTATIIGWTQREITDLSIDNVITYMYMVAVAETLIDLYSIFFLLIQWFMATTKIRADRNPVKVVKPKKGKWKDSVDPEQLYLELNKKS